MANAVNATGISGQPLDFASASRHFKIDREPDLGRFAKDVVIMAVAQREQRCGHEVVWSALVDQIFYSLGKTFSAKSLESRYERLMSPTNTLRLTFREWTYVKRRLRSSKSVDWQRLCRLPVLERRSPSFMEDLYKSGYFDSRLQPEEAMWLSASQGALARTVAFYSSRELHEIVYEVFNSYLLLGGQAPIDPILSRPTMAFGLRLPVSPLSTSSDQGAVLARVKRLCVRREIQVDDAQ